MSEHSTLTGGDLHEPKGVATANAGDIYIADGLGSGAWKQTGFSVHGEMVIINNTTAETTPTAVDATFNTDSDYAKVVTGWTAGHLDLITFNIDELVIPTAGDYEIHAWADIQLPSNNQKVAIKYAINDTTPYSSRKLIATSGAANDIVNVAGSAYVSGLIVSDTISIYIATDKATDPIILEAGIVCKLIHET